MCGPASLLRALSCALKQVKCCCLHTISDLGVGISRWVQMKGMSEVQGAMQCICLSATSVSCLTIVAAFSGSSNWQGSQANQTGKDCFKPRLGLMRTRPPATCDVSQLRRAAKAEHNLTSAERRLAFRCRKKNGKEPDYEVPGIRTCANPGLCCAL